MSSIYGFINEGLSKPKLYKNLKYLYAWNKQYGNYKQNVYLKNSFGVGCCLDDVSKISHNDVSIIEIGKCIFVIDAVIYNRDYLVKKVKEQNYNICDEELLALFIIKYGFIALRDVNGDFAGFCYDGNDYILFRDHSGIRPLHYAIDNDIFAFSTDLRGLLAIPDIDSIENKEKLYLTFCGFNTLHQTDTYFQNIRCVRPGTYLKVKEKNHKFKAQEIKYWKPATKKIVLNSDQDYQNNLRELVFDAIKCRADAVNGDIGGELSGGLDSSVIDIILSRLGYKGKYISWSFPYEKIPLQKDDERLVIEDICKQEGISCKFLGGKPYNIEKAVKMMLPPELNDLGIYESANALKKIGITAAFTGQGGDEIVSHRCNILELWHQNERLHYFKEMFYRTKGLNLRFLRFFKYSMQNIIKIYPCLLEPYNSNKSIENLCNKAFLQDSKDIFKPSLTFSYDPKYYYLNGGERHRLDLLAYFGAAAGVRYFIPYLDYRLVDYCLSIPRNQFIRNDKDRWIFRQTFNDLMPESLREVNYKDAPSTRNRERTKGTTIDVLLSIIDKNRWKEYLNFDYIDKFYKNFCCNKKEKNNVLVAQGLWSSLTVLILIDNLQKHAYTWAKNNSSSFDNLIIKH